MARRKARSTIYMVSVGVHLALGAAIALIPKDKLREVVGIAMSETSKKPTPREEPPKKREETPRAHRAQPGKARAAAAPVAAAAAMEAAPMFTDIGIALDASAVGGIPVNIAPKVQEKLAPAPIEPPKPKVLAARLSSDQCSEPIVKARIERQAAPQYTPQARAARVDGRVRLEIQVDENGLVRDVRVVKGLGYGLDEAAVAAARKMSFRAATLCGKPVKSSFALSMRFDCSVCGD